MSSATGRNRGGLSHETLAELVAAGLSTRQIADRFDRSYATIRYWLARYDLETAPTVRRRSLREALDTDDPEPIVVCPRCGPSPHRRRPGRGLVCLRCRSAAVSRRRRRIKAILVAEAGGECLRCGYSESQAALQFHHLNPSTKEFGVSLRGMSLSLDRARAEAAKCVLLCANCHAMVEAGVAALP